MNNYRLFKRGKVYQIGWTEDGKKFFRSTKQTTYPEALKVFKQFETDNCTDKTYRLSEVLDLYIQKAAHKLRTRNTKEVERIVNLFITVNGDRPIHKYTVIDLTKFQSFNKSEKVKDTTNNIRYRTVSTVFGFAFRVGLLKKNPFSGTKQIEIPKPKPTYIPQEKFNDFINSIDSIDMRDIYTFAALTGFRLSEIAYLRWSSVDFKNNQIVVAINDEFITKSGKERQVPMHPVVRSMMERKKGNAERSIYVFCKNTGVRYSTSYITHSFKEAAVNHGLDSNIHFHSLRHTFASWIMQNGGNIYSVKDLLGHSSVQVTEIYSHLTPTKLHSTVELIGFNNLSLVKDVQYNVAQ